MQGPGYNHETTIISCNNHCPFKMAVTDVFAQVGVVGGGGYFI